MTARIAGVVVLLLLVVGCNGKSDTGFTGLWSRGTDQARVSIRKEGDAWRFCWSVQPRDEGPRVACAADGRTEMVENGVTTYEYVTQVREESPGVLLVHVEGHPVDSNKTPIDWVDRLEMQPGGQEILVYGIELNAKPRPRPTGPARLAKIADDPS